MKSLHLTPLGNNVTEVRYGTNYVLFSYQTAVAYCDKGGLFFVSSTKYSKTTTKHIKAWLKDMNYTVVSQETIDNLIK